MKARPHTPEVGREAVIRPDTRSNGLNNIGAHLKVDNAGRGEDGRRALAPGRHQACLYRAIIREMMKDQCINYGC